MIAESLLHIFFMFKHVEQFIDIFFQRFSSVSVPTQQLVALSSSLQLASRPMSSLSRMLEQMALTARTSS